MLDTLGVNLLKFARKLKNQFLLIPRTVVYSTAVYAVLLFTLSGSSVVMYIYR